MIDGDAKVLKYYETKEGAAGEPLKPAISLVGYAASYPVAAGKDGFFEVRRG